MKFFVLCLFICSVLSKEKKVSPLFGFSNNYNFTLDSNDTMTMDDFKEIMSDAIKSEVDKIVVFVDYKVCYYSHNYQY